jgi:arginyl-tRNA synthetase
MGLEEQLRLRLVEVLAQLAAEGIVVVEAALRDRVSIEPPPKGTRGHLATNAAMLLAKAAGRAPRSLAELLAERLGRAPEVDAVEVAGPGFLNLTFRPAAFQRVLEEVLAAGSGYGRALAATGERVNVEFVSANPTGPLLISHGRGAVVGDVVARLLEVTGHRVTREYYINDFGNQVRLLAESVQARAVGAEAPEGGYGGGYVDELVSYIRAHTPDLLASSARNELKRWSIRLMLDGIPGSALAGIRPMLRAMGIEFDVWTSEEGLHRWGHVSRTLEELEARGRTHRGADGAVFFTAGGDDDKDRVIQKSDGDLTYFAGDIAYHQDKFARGFERMIDVWGADHHGYIPRVRSALEALGYDANRFEVLLFQLVKLTREGREVRMGKRLGNLITLQEVMEEIDSAVNNPNAGRDALRVYFLSRRVDTPITLDLDLAKKQEAENPVFYLQYGHARLCSILRRALEKFGLEVPRYSPSLAARITHPLELQILAELGRYPAVLREAAGLREPQKVLGYVNGLAQAFQSYYTQLRVEGDAILPSVRQQTEGWERRWDRDKTLGRLLWVDGIRTVYRSGLELMGVDAPERMVRAGQEEQLEEVDA